jgi:iron(II)-dependent oxidoreductase
MAIMSTIDNWREDVAAKLAHTRDRTIAVIDPLAESRLGGQVRPFMSPLIWDLGHIAGFERLWLVDAIEGMGTAALESKYNALETPRAARAELALPSKAQVLGQLHETRRRVLEVLATVDPQADEPLLRNGYVYRMVIQHEGQHQETMLQALDIPGEAGWGHPHVVAPRDRAPGAGADADVGGDTTVDDTLRVSVPGGAFLMGTADRSRAYDNERPVHEVHVDGFEIDRYPVTNRRWLEFVDDGGYRRTELWGDGGREWLSDTAPGCPQGWVQGDNGWTVSRFGETVALDAEEPVQHVCYWEAMAFARWAGGRLPTEGEWEKAAAWGADADAARTYPWGDAGPRSSGLLELDAAGPQPEPVRFVAGCPPRIGRFPNLCSRYGVEDMLGLVYEWTSSAFTGYPGFEAFPYREYSEVFFARDYRVLRGASWAAHPMLWRNTYRNWDLPQRRQIFAGVRVAYGDR